MSEKSDERPHPLANYPAPPPRGEDLPYDDGEPMESERHVEQMTLLIESLDYAWRDRQDFYVGGNMFLYFSETQSRKNDFRGPDVFVALDVVRHRVPERRSWVVWEEGGRGPSVVIELLSPSTEAIDRGEKMRVYAKVLRVPAYFLYDPFTLELEGYRLNPASLEYERIAADARGFVPCGPLDLFLGVAEGTYRQRRHPWLRWIGADGKILPTDAEDVRQMFAEAERRIEAEALRADEEKRRADDQKRRADELEARLRALESREKPG